MFTKEFGEIGIRHFEDFNWLMLSIVVRDILKQPYKLWVHEYFQQSSFLNVSVKPLDSFVWMGLWAQDAMKDGFFLKIGNGLDINVWKNPWIPCILN